MKFLLLAILTSFSIAAQAKVEVLFHPHDPTLEKIAQWISEAQSTVDIAMYNMDLTPASPIVQMLQTREVQNRIQSGSLKIRMALELYGTPDENQRKRQAAEELGIDVRYLGRSVKAHHKFAVIDANLPFNRVITGSANWSLSSYRGYNENILYFTQEPEINFRYATEFHRLWKASKEFGVHRDDEVAIPNAFEQADVEVYYNSPRTIDRNSTEESNLTAQIVKLINGAQSELQIATTRIRLVPILEALQAAAKRGVKIQAVISQDDFKDLGERAKYLGPNIDLRVKFYNLKVENYMTYQMHNKFMIVDKNKIMTGSFNWSFSSENNHLENIVVLSGNLGASVLPNYSDEFNSIWNMGRSEYGNTLESLKLLPKAECAIPAMALYPQEIRELLKYGHDCK